MSNPIPEPRIVIYGGGIAGALLAKRLSPKIRITLVDPNEYFEVPMAVPRSLVNSRFAERAIIPFAAALPGVDLVRGALRELQADGGVVALQDGSQRIPLGSGPTSQKQAIQ